MRTRRGFWCVFAVVVVCLNVSAFAATFAGGTGEPNDPYQIATAEQFLSIGADTSLASKHFALVADIDLDPNLLANDMPGTMPNLTTGSIDGRGHKLVNAHIYANGRGRTVGAGTIGAGAVIRNLVVEHVSFSAGADGCVIAKNDGFLVNCSVEGISKGLGLVAENSGHIIHCSVTGGSEPTAPLVGKNSGSILYSSVTGGLASVGALVPENYGTILGCHATADVTGTTIAGGLVGTNYGTISCCYATGDVNASDAHSVAGGLVGRNDGVISDCYALGAVDSTYHPGGLAGDNSGTIARCYAVGVGCRGLTYAAYPGRVDHVDGYVLRPNDANWVSYGGGIPLADAQMRRQESFIGWDFWGDDRDGPFEVWTMPQDGGYPVLRATLPSPFTGAGTAEDPYLIESADQIPAVCRDLDACYRMTTDISLQGESYVRSVIPLFWGHFDGGGHSVSMFSLTGGPDAGFFGTIQAGASVTDLNLCGIHVLPGEYVGNFGVLAVLNYGAVTGCSTSADTASTYGVAGGLVAINESSGRIARSFVRWAASGMSHLDRLSQLTQYGGVAACNRGSIVECHVSGFVDGRVPSSAGCLVGQNDGTIRDSYADGYGWGGGLVGLNSGEVTRCYAATFVQPSVPGIPRGGLVAKTLGGTIASSYFLAPANGGGPDNSLGVLLTDTQMKQQASFVNWDFTAVWTIREGDGYPTLRWENRW